MLAEATAFKPWWPSLVDEDFDDQKNDYLADLLLKCFNEGYKKFSDDPSYLYYAGRIGVISEWYLGLEAISKL